MTDEMTIMQVVEYLGLSDKTVRRYIKRGRLPAYQRTPGGRGPGAGFRFKRCDVEMFKHWYNQLRPV